MTTDNKELILKLYGYFDTGEIEKLMSHIHTDACWFIIGDHEDIPISGNANGHQEILGLFQSVFDHLDIQQNGPDQVFGEKSHFAAYGNLKATGKKTGNHFESKFVDLFVFRDGKIASYERFFDTLRMYRTLK